MNAEIFAEWLRRQGHRVYKTSCSYWYDAAPRVLQAFPYHWLITPDEQETCGLMVDHRILALRYSTPSDFREGKMSYHIVLDKSYDLHMLNHKARNGVRRGLEHFTVEEISFTRLAKEGWVLQEDTQIRQNRQGSLSQKQWEILCRSADDLPGFHAFAAICGGELAGALIVCRIDDVFSVPYAMSHCRFLQNHVNNALFFKVCCDLLRQEKITGIFFCVESLDAPSHNDDFKIRMGFEPRMVRQRVEIHPYLKRLVVPSFHNGTRMLLKRFPSSPQLAKAEGMLRFYFDGKRPVYEQPLPVCLVTQ